MEKSFFYAYFALSLMLAFALTLSVPLTVRVDVGDSGGNTGSGEGSMSGSTSSWHGAKNTKATVSTSSTKTSFVSVQHMTLCIPIKVIVM